MTLIATHPQSPVAPTLSFAEAFKAFLLQEAKARVEEICREVLASLDASVSPSEAPLNASTPADGFILTATENASEPPRKPADEVSETEVIPTAPCKRKCSEKRLRANREAGAKRKLDFVIPHMMMLDMDFGGTMNSDAVCKRCCVSRKYYHRIKKNVLAINRLHKVFGGQLGSVKTAEIAQISRETLNKYLKIMKEGFNAGNQ